MYFWPTSAAIDMRRQKKNVLVTSAIFVKWILVSARKILLVLQKPYEIGRVKFYLHYLVNALIFFNFRYNLRLGQSSQK